MFSRNALLKYLDATFGAAICRFAGHINYWRHREIYLDAVPADEVSRILVLRPGGMGDMLLLLPVLDVLHDRFPNAEVDLVCEKRNMAVLKLAGFSGRALLYDGNPFTFIRSLRDTHYDLALDSEQFHNFSAVFAWLSGARVRVGFNINPLRNPLYTHLVPYAPDGHESVQFGALLGPVAAGAAPKPLDGRLKATATGTTDIAPAPGEGLRRIAIHTGSSADFKCWGEERFLQLARRLIESGDWSPSFVGSGKELAMARRIADQLPANRAAVIGLPSASLAVTAQALANSDVFVGADSGLAHLAAAVGVPSVVLFGPSSDRKWGTRSGLSRVVMHDVPCRPCCIFGYHKPCHRVICMRGINVDDVFDAIKAIPLR